MSSKARQSARDRATKAAAAAVEAQEANPIPTEVRLSNGIVLALKPIPPGIIERAADRLEKPTVPKVLLKDKGVEEENPGDPEYVAAMEAYQALRIETITNTMLLVGTAVQEIPEGLFGPEDIHDWPPDAELMEHLGVEVNIETKFDRYLSWLSLYAMAKQGDIWAVMAAVNRVAGIGEEDVRTAVASFRNREARRADRDVPAEAPG